MANKGCQVFSIRNQCNTEKLTEGTKVEALEGFKKQEICDRKMDRVG